MSIEFRLEFENCYITGRRSHRWSVIFIFGKFFSRNSSTLFGCFLFLVSKILLIFTTDATTSDEAPTTTIDATAPKKFLVSMRVNPTNDKETQEQKK